MFAVGGSVVTLDSDLAAQRALNRMLRDWGWFENDDQIWVQTSKLVPLATAALLEDEQWDNRARRAVDED